MTNDKDSAVLASCPNVLCGSNNTLVWQSDMRKKQEAWCIMCRDCGASVGQKYDTEAEAIAAWNTRQPQTDALKIARDALRNIQIEAEREQGSWVHLKRVIALNCKQTLAALDAVGLEIREKGQ